MKTIFSIGLLIFRWVPSVCADEIIAPAAQATQSGNAFVIDPFHTPGTIDTVYGAANFSRSIQINGLAFRINEGSAGLSFDTVIPRVTIRMSTYSGTYNSYLVGPGYNGNKGPDDTTVFDASVHWTTTDLPGSGPNPFDLKILFSTPFIYDPAKGRLLMDFTTSGQFTSGITPDAQGHGDSIIGWLGDKSLDSLVTQFDVTSVPEPSSIFLVALGFAAIVGKKMRICSNLLFRFQRFVRTQS